MRGRPVWAVSLVGCILRLTVIFYARYLRAYNFLSMSHRLATIFVERLSMFDGHVQYPLCEPCILFWYFVVWRWS